MPVSVTAATIWVNAAIGMAAGLGSYALATGVAAITLAVLAVVPVMDRLVERRGGREPDNHRPDMERLGSGAPPGRQGTR